MDSEEPSRVIHARNVTTEISQADLHAVCSQFGTVENIVVLREKNQALIQFDTVNSAAILLNSFPMGYTDICGRRIYLKYSRHRELTGKAAAVGSILLVSSFNPVYDIRTVLQITSDIIFQVFSPYGCVQKIVVIQKQGTMENRQQALVQYDKHETAETAKQLLQGQNVYVGSAAYFTLDIQFSNLEDLTIKTPSPFAKIFNADIAPQVASHQSFSLPSSQEQFQFQQQSLSPQQHLQSQLLLQQQLFQQQLLQQQLLQNQHEQSSSPSNNTVDHFQILQQQISSSSSSSSSSLPMQFS